MLLVACSSTELKPRKNAAKPTVSEEVVIDLLGMKLASHGIWLPKARRQQYTLEITAVQENGPAFFAMMQPGDRITRARGMGPMDAKAFANALSRTLKISEVVGVEYVYMAEDGNLRPGRAEVLPQPSQGGRWITTRIGHKSEQSQFTREKLSGVEEARAAADLQIDELKTQAQHDISVNPCAFDERAIVQMVQRMKLNARYTGSDLSGVEYKLFHLARKACANVTQGTLPEFEATLIAMISNSINACDYPSANHQAALDAARTDVPKTDYSQRVMNLAARLSSPMRSTGRNAPTAAEIRRYNDRNECILKFVQNRLLGKGDM